MKIIDEKETQKKQRQERTRETVAIVKGWELDDFAVRLC